MLQSSLLQPHPQSPSPQRAPSKIYRNTLAPMPLGTSTWRPHLIYQTMAQQRTQEFCQWPTFSQRLRQARPQ